MAEQTYPFNDDELKFNSLTGRYEATTTLARNRNIDLNELDDFGSLSASDFQARFMIDRSNDIYRCILTRNPNKRYVEKVLSEDPEVREKIKDWIIMQTIYVMRGGITGEHTGFNAGSGKMVKLSDLRGDRMYSAQMLDEMRICGILNKNYKNYVFNN